jgi:hypothetical protein
LPRKPPHESIVVLQMSAVQALAVAAMNGVRSMPMQVHVHIPAKGVVGGVVTP